MKLPVVLLLLLFAATGPTAFAKERSRLSLGIDGGYIDLVLAIDRSLPEDSQLVEKIKNTLEEFSKQLSVATRPMFSTGASLRLAHAFILVPKTWTNRTAVDANSTWQTFENSDIRLGRSPHEPHYTYHSSPSCGVPGDYTVFDTEHVNGTDAFWLGKQMLSEFGQLRWGLRSEHNGKNGVQYFTEGGKIVPAICTKGINGSFRHNVTNEHCKVNLTTTELEPNCKFYPEPQQNGTASVLGTTAVRGIEHFCDHWDSGLEELKHSRRAPVPLNSACLSAGSARNVMRISQSGDFNRPPTPNGVLPPVQYTVVRPLPYRRLVLIIDISGSMDGDPLNKIKTGVDKFIRDLVEDGVECALVTFSDRAQLVKPLNFFSSMQIREEYAGAVRVLVADGYTAIGDALALGMQTLGVDPAHPSRNVPGYMLLLTDGEENRARNYTLVQATAVLRNTSIIVDTVAFGRQADKNLTQLSEDTNGLSFFCRFENSTNDFIEQLSETVRKRVESVEMPIEVFSAPISTTFNIPVNIDKSIGKDTSFMLSTYRASDIASMDLKVVSPNGDVYDRDSPQYHKDILLGTVTIRISGLAKEGEWRASDGRSAQLQPSWSSAQVFNTRTALTVTSKPASEEEPVVLDGSVSADISINLNRSTSITIVASMFRGFERVIGATILAKIESESNTDIVLTLQDSGVFPDVEAGDGIYSVQVPLKSVSKVQEYNVRLISDSPVSRVTSAGKFYVKSVDLGSLQNLPPNPVMDLKVSVDLPSKMLHIWWTAVGDEQDQGTAARCIIKSSENDTLIEEDFDSADNVSVTVTPLQAGSIQSVSISSDQLAVYNSTFYLAVRTVSSKGVESGLSNLVATQLKLPDNIDSIDGTITSTSQEPSTTVAPEIMTTTSGVRGSLQGSGVTGLLLVGFSLSWWLLRP